MLDDQRRRTNPKQTTLVQVTATVTEEKEEDKQNALQNWRQRLVELSEAATKEHTRTRDSFLEIHRMREEDTVMKEKRRGMFSFLLQRSLNSEHTIFMHMRSQQDQEEEILMAATKPRSGKLDYDDLGPVETS